MNADEHQVGGNHYKTGYEHWNLVLNVGMDYFAGCATKYVCRWRLKGTPVSDLQKALHFLNKLAENWIRETSIAARPSQPVVIEEVKRFSEINKLGDLERAFVERMCTWRNESDLDVARQMLLLLMDEAEAIVKKVDGRSCRLGPECRTPVGQACPDPLCDFHAAKPVPLTEENHHAERYTGA